MNQRNIIIAIVVLVIIALGLWYWTSAPAPAGTPVTTTATTTPQETGSNGSTGSTSNTGGGTTLRAIASQSGNYTCSLNITGASGQTNGTIYGASGKTRLDLTIPSNNGSVRTHIIRSSGYSYTWVEGQTVGVKAAISAGSPTIPPAQGGSISDDSTVSSDCHAWSPDMTQFTPPTGITFTAR